MRTLRTLSLAAAAVSVAVALTGCSSSTEGTANPVGASGMDKTGTPAAFDLCSALSIKDLEGTYLRSELPFTVTKHIESEPYHEAGTAGCYYGTWIESGVKLRVPLGDPAPDVSDLLGRGSSIQKEVKPFTGSDTGYLHDQGIGGIHVAVQHGDAQFMLDWKSMGDVENDRVTPDQMIALATKVAEKLPTKLTLRTHDLPEECSGLKGMDKIVGGKVTMAWGTADRDNLNCDYLGPKGFLTAEALAWPSDSIESQISTSLDISREDELKPALAADVVTFANGLKGGIGQGDGLKVDGYLRLCCQFDVEYKGIDYNEQRSEELDADERQFLTSVVDAARTWK